MFHLNCLYKCMLPIEQIINDLLLHPNYQVLRVSVKRINDVATGRTNAPIIDILDDIVKINDIWSAYTRYLNMKLQSTEYLYLVESSIITRINGRLYDLKRWVSGKTNLSFYEAYLCIMTLHELLNAFDTVLKDIKSSKEV